MMIQDNLGEASEFQKGMQSRWWHANHKTNLEVAQPELHAWAVYYLT